MRRRLQLALWAVDVVLQRYRRGNGIGLRHDCVTGTRAGRPSERESADSTGTDGQGERCRALAR